MSNPEAINDTNPIPTAESPTPDPTPITEPHSVAEAAPAPRSQDTGSVVQHATPPIPQRQPYISREERDRRRKEAIAALVVGEWREGKVTGIAQFGAFVDLGGVDGLVHVSQLGAGGYVERVEDVVQVGQTVRVRVVDVDLERGRVGLSMREPRTTSAPPRDKPAPGTAPRPARPATVGFPPPITESLPEPRHDRRTRSPGGGGGERPSFGSRDERPARRSERPRRHRDTEDEEWRTLRGDPRGYLSTGDEPDEEPMPTTAEELVARFGRRGTNR